MPEKSSNSELVTLADVLANVLIRQILAAREAASAVSGSAKMASIETTTNKKTPGPFGDSPERSDVF